MKNSSNLPPLCCWECISEEADEAGVAMATPGWNAIEDGGCVLKPGNPLSDVGIIPDDALKEGGW